MTNLLWQVNEVLKSNSIKPHWMFALDDLLRSAVHCAITVLSPGVSLLLLSTSLWKTWQSLVWNCCVTHQTGVWVVLCFPFHETCSY